MNLDFLFNEVLKELNLPIKTEEEYIRIEKSLKLQEKLNEDIDKNEVDIILEILKLYPEEFKFLVNEKNLVNFLLKKNFIAAQISSLQSEEFIDNFSKFISTYFNIEFGESFDFYLKNKKYTELNIISNYFKIIPINSVETIHEKLIDKLDLAIDLFMNNSSIELLKKYLFCLHSSSFWEFISVFQSYQIENKINDLINISADQINSKNFKSKVNFYLKFYKALKSYNSLDDDLHETIHKNYLYAKENLSNIPVVGNYLNPKWFFLIYILVKLILYSKSCN